MKASHSLEKLVIIAGLSLGIEVTSPQSALAARPCVENFSEKGDSSAGKGYKSFIDVKGTTADKAYVAIGRQLAKEGYLGVAVSKDLGLVSAYKEERGKKTPCRGRPTRGETEGSRSRAFGSGSRPTTWSVPMVDLPEPSDSSDDALSVRWIRLR